MTKSAGPWTEAAVSRLREIYDRYPASQIAAMMNSQFGAEFSRNAIIGKIHRMGLTEPMPKKPRPEPKPRRESTRKIAKRTAPPKPVSDAPASSLLPFVPRVVDISLQHIPFAEINDSRCKYECSGLHDPALFTFCGRPSNGTPYCAAHARICYTPAPTRRRMRPAA